MLALHRLALGIAAALIVVYALVCAVVAWGVLVALAGLARSLWAVVALLALAGAADLVSAVFRQSILLVYAPDRLRLDF